MNSELCVPGGTIARYIATVKAIPSLSKEEERVLALRFHDNNDLQAARQLVMAHLHYVVYIARRYSGYGLPQQDLIQEGSVGLMKAVKHFDPSQNVRLMTFAVYWVKSEIQSFILKNWRIVKVATTKAQRKLFFNLRKNKSHLGWFSQAETEALANKLGVPSDVVTQMERRLSEKDAVLDEPRNHEDSDGYSNITIQLSDPSADPAQKLEKSDADKHRRESLFYALDTLDERSQAIIRSRWLTEKKLTLLELSKCYGLSAERIRQLEKKAFIKLRNAVQPM